jgi:predicted site-specific integrase-resolvase
MADQFVSAREAQDITGVSRHTITSACKSGEISGARQMGKVWIMPRTSLEVWMQSGRRKMGRPRKQK